ncbi:hypothetical protein BDZ94DRAFT_381997 [Collybia nuda]|uniref:F-box domain-containing protein n=1 Tax=Collybia nuda TaxID=64659 RepID=A0A9P5YI53_9AGAR|nr:hypothetical protein BDZ94DRAFT_381997 [Collybia nuda]
MTTQVTLTTLFEKQVVLAPPCYIGLLNSDVLFQIFSLVVNLQSPNEEAPVILSKVSPIWRLLVINAPTLWTQIRIHEPLRASKSHIMFRRTLRRTHYFLERSQKCPLKLDITIQTLHMRKTPMHHETHPYREFISGFRRCTMQLSRILGAHAARFAEFRLRADELTSVADIEKYIPCAPMPFLTYWRVAQNASHTVLDPHPLYEVKNSQLSFLLRPDDSLDDCSKDLFPNLRRVRLISIPLDWDKFGPANLSSLSLSLLPNSARPTASALCKLLLASAPTLEILDLDGCVRIDTQVSSYIPFTLPHVHTLTLGYRFAQELIPLLHAIHLPHLRSLALTDHYQRLRHRSGARTSRFDRRIDPLLRTLTENFPLRQLTRLALHHIRFLPSSAQERAAFGGEFGNVPNAHGAFIPTTLFAFLSALTELQALVLTGPDYTLLEALGYAPPAPRRIVCTSTGTREEDAKPGIRPVPRLEFLSLAAFNIFAVRNYLIFRYMSDQPPLATLEFHMPVGWLRSKHLLLAEKVARATAIVPITLRRNEEADLWREVGIE